MLNTQITKTAQESGGATQSSSEASRETMRATQGSPEAPRKTVIAIQENSETPRTHCNMLGAIVGDVIGSGYEWNNIKTTEFPLFQRESSYTDDSVMTIAVAHALLGREDVPSRDTLPSRNMLQRAFTSSMQSFGRHYPGAGYGSRFYDWVFNLAPEPYNSWGNGSAMRVSPVAWVANSVEECEQLAMESALVTHNHPEGVKGAQATAACIFLARMGYDNDEIRCYVEENHGYDLDFSIDSIRKGYNYDISCQGSVPPSIVAFLESNSFEDALRRIISIGGDSDTLGAITASIAQARYGIPAGIAAETRTRLPQDLLEVVDCFCDIYL